MKKRIFFLAFVLISLASCTKYEIIFDTEANEDFELSLILNLNGIDCAYDAATNTLRYSASQAELSNFEPRVVFQDYTEVTFGGVELTNYSKNSLGSLQLNKRYPIEFETKEKTTTLYLEFTSVPVVQIVTLDLVHKEEKILGKLTVQYPEKRFPDLTTFVGVEYRGKSSLALPKKSYGIKPLSSANLEDVKKVSFFGYRPNDKWSFDALYNDPSKIRNKLSYEVWKSMNHPSIESNYVEVFINNESQGIFRLGEVYTQSKLQLAQDSRLYKGLDNSKFTKFTDYSQRLPRSAIWANWEQEFPDPKTEISWNSFQEFAKIVVKGSNQEFTLSINQQVDLQQVIDYYLFVQLCYAKDNVGKNWFYLKQSANSPFQILLWDVDATWGRDENGSNVSHRLLVENGLFDRLIQLNPDNAKTKIKTRWTELRNNQFSTSQLFLLIDNELSAIENHGVIQKETAIWGQTLNLRNEQTYLNNWLSNRLNFLDDYFNNL